MFIKNSSSARKAANHHKIAKGTGLFGCFLTPTQGGTRWVVQETRRHGYGGSRDVQVFPI
jgi:hypothetical protein